MAVTGDSPDDRGESFEITVQHLDTSFVQRLRLGRGLERAIVSKRGERDRGILITWNAPRDVRVLPVLDRAHFPVDDQIEELHPSPDRSRPVEQIL